MQVEEATVESLRKDKTATEKALQEAVERTQVELAIQKEFYTNALNEAKEAEVRAEIRADNEAKLELERRLREAGDREAALVQNLDELRQALSRTAQQVVHRTL
jgi:pyruvate/2-oxoacid:ferredoxin oxidoreductase beta subunit